MFGKKLRLKGLVKPIAKVVGIFLCFAGLYGIGCSYYYNLKSEDLRILSIIQNNIDLCPIEIYQDDIRYERNMLVNNSYDVSYPFRIRLEDIIRSFSGPRAEEYRNVLEELRSLPPDADLTLRARIENELEIIRKEFREIIADSPFCNIRFSIQAPAFEVSSNRTEILALNSEQDMYEISWIVMPTVMGTQQIALSFDRYSGVYIIEIEVLNSFGLSIRQVQILSMVATFVGFVLSLPFISDLYRHIRKKQKGFSDG